MTDLFAALLLGIIEGITEFLPISSTGHLIVVGDLLDFNGERATAFKIIIQLGAILAVMWEFRQRILSVVTGLGSDPMARRFTVNLMIAFFPAVVLGLLFADLIEHWLFNPITVSAADLAFCVQEVNRYRATVGAGPLSQQAALEATAAQAAQSDHQSGEAHGWVRRNGGPAENQAPRWSRASSGGNAQTFISRALQLMWAEGPGGGHYENMRGRFAATGCAIYSDTATATFVQHFR